MIAHSRSIPGTADFEAESRKRTGQNLPRTEPYGESVRPEVDCDNNAPHFSLSRALDVKGNRDEINISYYRDNVHTTLVFDTNRWLLATPQNSIATKTTTHRAWLTSMRRHPRRTTTYRLLLAARFRPTL